MQTAGAQMTTTETAITASGVTMWYETQRGEQVNALDHVSLEVRSGEFLSLIGPSGCGKSTLLYILGGLRRQSAGEIWLGGERVTGPMPAKVGFVFQDYTLFPWRTIIANVETGLEFRGVARRARRQIAMEKLDLVGLSGFANAYPGELSGGMQQRVALARALATDPEILLMDEPFGALDEQTRTVLGEELAKILEQTGKTIVFVTHSLSEAVFLSDRVVVMSSRPGRIKDILTVDAPRPRGAAFTTSPEFTDTRNRLFELLHEEVRAATLAEIQGGGADE